MASNHRQRRETALRRAPAASRAETCYRSGLETDRNQLVTDCGAPQRQRQDDPGWLAERQHVLKLPAKALRVSGPHHDASALGQQLVDLLLLPGEIIGVHAQRADLGQLLGRVADGDEWPSVLEQLCEMLLKRRLSADDCVKQATSPYRRAAAAPPPGDSGAIRDEGRR